MLAGLNGWHLVIILVIVLLLFGAPKLPGLAKSIGQSMRIFKGEVKSMKEDDVKPEESAPSAQSWDPKAQAPAAPQAPAQSSAPTPSPEAPAAPASPNTDAKNPNGPTS